jgi:molybdate transport system regulatory protein
MGRYGHLRDRSVLERLSVRRIRVRLTTPRTTCNSQEGNPMKISARNVLAGEVKSVTRGAVNAEVSLGLQGGETITAIITNNSADSLELAKGKKAFAIVKASEVMIGKDLENAKLSARNILAGKVVHVTTGAVNSEIVVSLHGATEVIASITKASVEALALKVGDEVSAVIKASNVLIGL